ncbi:MAG: hypothetical protein ABSG19_03555 [Candidatus Aminicenantales bacterium]
MTWFREVAITPTLSLASREKVQPVPGRLMRSNRTRAEIWLKKVPSGERVPSQSR